MAEKWVYLFREGNGEMKDLLGGKGAGLCEMTNTGLPVPPGFVITARACNEYYAADKEFPPGMWEQTLEALKTIEGATGKKFGDPEIPLLVSVRSGAKTSMPGMMETVLNLGLNDETLNGMIGLTNNERFAYDTYRRFIQMFGRVVLGIDGEEFDQILEGVKQRVGAKLDTELRAEDLKVIASQFRQLVRDKTRNEFPNDPFHQLRLAIGAVFDSWNSRRAIDYRNFNKIPHDLGTAVSVVTMVFGNMGHDSGSGVAFTRDPATGDRLFYGEYLLNAQGEDVVAGYRTPQKIADLQQQMPQVYQELVQIASRLETHYRDAQDLEFTIERGKLFLLQTRTAKRTARAALKMAVDMVTEGLITREEAIQRIEPNQVSQLLLPQFDDRAKEETRSRGGLLATGLNASPGAASGKAILDANKAEELGSQGESVILVRPETNADDIHGMLRAKGILTARGGATSHAAVVARGLGKPCVAGCEALQIDLGTRQFSLNGKVIKENQEISIDGTTGEIFMGSIPTIEPNLSQETNLTTLLDWANQIKRLGVWANADYPRDAAKAVEFGAEGIGLCRTEHMFFEEERLPIVQKMILAAAEATSLENELTRRQREVERAPQSSQKELRERLIETQQKVNSSPAVINYHEALAELLGFQVEDFKGIFRVMAGKPVIVRLLDPPLHEFLPSYEELLVEITELRILGTDPDRLVEKEKLFRRVDSMRELNPMLGLRGCRLGLMFSAIYEMQVQAILTAACELTNEGVDVHPEIMIPVVSHVNEIKVLKERLEKVANQVELEMGINVPHKFGVMIEIPSAALTADEIAAYAEFFSFGTNDLTQTTLGYSRDDAEGKFLLQYVDQGILEVNPFQVVARGSVGKLIQTAVKLGRSTRPDLSIGICGEHGGEPSSIEFCHQVGLDYVSCSPYRVSLARLAAAQAALASVEQDR